MEHRGKIYEYFYDLITFTFDYVEGRSVKLRDGRRSWANGKRKSRTQGKDLTLGKSVYLPLRS